MVWWIEHCIEIKETLVLLVTLPPTCCLSLHLSVALFPLPLCLSDYKLWGRSYVSVCVHIALSTMGPPSMILASKGFSNTNNNNLCMENSSMCISGISTTSHWAVAPLRGSERTDCLGRWVLRDFDMPEGKDYSDLAGGPSHEAGAVESQASEMGRVTEWTTAGGLSDWHS